MSESFFVAGLSRPAEIVVDRFGIPHLYAESVDDVYLVQGFNAARDRLFQIDLWRRRGLGRLAEVLGPAYARQDEAARLFLYRGDPAAEWAAYGFDAEAVATRFVTGINAYVDWVVDHPGALPPEFTLAGYLPSRWDPFDVVRIRAHGPQLNVVSEFTRARMAAVAGDSDGLAADRLRQPLMPEHSPEVPPNLDLDLPDEVLLAFQRATAAVWTGGDLDGGSNNWAVAAHRTTTGRPILASDPHRVFSTPSLRYIAHLSAPDLDVIGAGEPALPGITLGHNGTAAFGFTIFPVDAADLYVYELDPADPSRYRFQDGWESFTVVRETLAVKGEPDRQLELVFTRHGPVIHTDFGAGRAYAVRTVWSEPGTAPYFGSIGYLAARSWSEFRNALRHWGSPGENHLYADVSGTIAWKAAGLVPRRVGYDGLLPVPGDGRYDWDGFYSADELPEVVDPSQGSWATANEYNLPDGFPAERRLSYEWASPARHQRIVDELSQPGPFSIQDMQRLQTDVLSLPAREVVASLARTAGIPTGAGKPPGPANPEATDRQVTDRQATDPQDRTDQPEPQAAAAIRMLTGWDGVEAADSGPAALYHVWVHRHLAPALAAALLPRQAAEVLPWLAPEALTDILAHPVKWFGDGGEVVLRRILTTTVAKAYAETESLLGEDPANWAWGALHHNRQPHPLEFLDPSLSIGPLSIGGSGTTVNATHYVEENFEQTIGASFRMIVDIGEWDNSVCINTPGQSGDPRSPHYRDLVEVWQRNGYVPMLYTRTAVEANAAERIRLLPAPPDGSATESGR